MDTANLYARGVLIGMLSPHKELEMDWPRFYYEFEPTPGYDQFRSLLDLDGRNKAFKKQMKEAEELNLKVEFSNGDVMTLRFIFLDEKKRLAVIRQGLIRNP